MKPTLLSVLDCNTQTINQIKIKLDAFYCSVTDYSAFETPSEQTSCWEHVADKIRALSANDKPVRVLEIGAGRSGFGQFLLAQGLRKQCVWTAQDVTQQNADWLNTYADKVIFGDIETACAEDGYEIVFSTFVLEHVVNPPAHLARLASLAKAAQGTLFIFCPRYDVPGYLAPSCRHLSRTLKLQFLLISVLSRIKTILTGKSAYLIQTDLAAFHQPFFTDADAVHWVSQLDLRCFARELDADFKVLKIANPVFPSKNWVVKRLLTVAVAIQL
jgi:2-polyprenyl-3-methyl-5-hydroxy-6-metoxy-1,4-benzoquinol methylase